MKPTIKSKLEGRTEFSVRYTQIQGYKLTVLWASSALGNCPSDILRRHLDVTELAMNAILKKQVSQREDFENTRRDILVS